MPTYKYPRPSVTVDCVVFGYEPDEALKVLLIKRGGEPFKGRWALPGGFVQMDEGLDTAARRELEEETGVRISYLEQLYTFGTPERDPRGRVISVAYYALVSLAQHEAQAASDAAETEWVPVRSALAASLAFDHHDILLKAVQRLRAKVRYEPVGFGLLPPTFTLPALLRLYEAILGTRLDKRNFFRKALEQGVLVAATGRSKGPAGRPAQLYRFDRLAYEKRRRSGRDFAL